ncbi:MAG: two-component sensor histidine kinase, partial [Flavobacteriaceae bacterium]|nr:two-component sensor histidine kinase [Flavobacteriaceae bacterium]
MKISAIQDYQIVIVLITSISFLVVMGGVIVVFFYFSRKKVLKTELEKANLEIIHQKEMIQANLITQEEERRRIAQDLHDAISSKLNIVSLNANFLADPDLHSE